MGKRVTFDTTINEPIIREIVGRAIDQQSSKGPDKQLAKDQNQKSTRDKGGENDKSQVTQVDVSMSLFQGRPETPPFLLTIHVFGKKLHNYLLDFGDSTKVMPFTVCKVLGITTMPSKCKVNQIDKTKVNVVGELNRIPMHVALDLRVHQVINIQVADISDTYGMILGRDFT